jgi:SAM-dependent methyltransferase
MGSEPTSTGAYTGSSRAYYDALARGFAELDDYWTNPYDVETWRMENALVARWLPASAVLLDLGVGFYPHVESTAGRRMICVDVSADSLRVAHAVTHDPRPRYLCADALTLPLADRSVDGIVAGGELVNHVDAERLLAELHRVLVPSGRVVLSIATKWCLDTLYCLLDAFLGLGIGYAMTRDEATAFVTTPATSSDVTWAVTPTSHLRVTLYTRRDLRRLLAASGFDVLVMRSLNVVSGIVPLPAQQDPDASPLAKRITAALLSIDRSIAGRIPGLRWLGGNVYLVLEKRAGDAIAPAPAAP